MVNTSYLEKPMPKRVKNLNFRRRFDSTKRNNVSKESGLFNHGRILLFFQNFKYFAFKNA
jgi:hypothetical protein